MCYNIKYSIRKYIGIIVLYILINFATHFYNTKNNHTQKLFVERNTNTKYAVLLLT